MRLVWLRFMIAMSGYYLCVQTRADASPACRTSYNEGSVVLESPTQLSVFDNQEGLSWRRASAPFTEPTGEALATLPTDESLGSNATVYTHASSAIAIILASDGSSEISTEGRTQIRVDDQPIFSPVFAPVSGRWRALAYLRGPNDALDLQVFERFGLNDWRRQRTGLPYCHQTQASLLVTTADIMYLTCNSSSTSAEHYRLTANTIDPLPSPALEGTSIELSRLSERADGAIVVMGFTSHYERSNVVDSLHRFVLAGDTWQHEELPMPSLEGFYAVYVHATSPTALLLSTNDQSAPFRAYYESANGVWTAVSLPKKEGDSAFPSSAAITASGDTLAAVIAKDPTSAMTFSLTDGVVTRNDFSIGSYAGQGGACGCRSTGSPLWLLMAFAFVGMARRIRRREGVRNSNANQDRR